MFTWCDYAFWAAETIGYIVVLLSIHHARAWRAWYSLSIYCSLQAVISFALYCMAMHKWWAWYFYTQWNCELAFCALRLVILWQIILDSISTTRAVPKPIQKAFLFSSLIVAAAAFTFGSTGAWHASHLPDRMLAFTRASLFAVIGVFSTFCGFSSTFGLKWKNRGLQIDLGITSIAVVDLLCFLAGTRWHGKGLPLYHLQVAFHLCSFFLWSRAFLISDAPPQPITEELRSAFRGFYQELQSDLNGPPTTEIWR
jgi:hypothetical protein